MVVIDFLAPSKHKRIKGTLQDWIDAVIMEKINESDKLFKKFKKSSLHIDKDNYKETRNEVEKLIRTKKKKLTLKGNWLKTFANLRNYGRA